MMHSKYLEHCTGKATSQLGSAQMPYLASVYMLLYLDLNLLLFSLVSSSDGHPTRTHCLVANSMTCFPCLRHFARYCLSFGCLNRTLCVGGKGPPRVLAVPCIQGNSHQSPSLWTRRSREMQGLPSRIGPPIKTAETLLSTFLGSSILSRP